MYRSVTFSEIFSSTVSDDLSKYDDSYDNNVKARFVAKLGIGLVELLLASIFLCYGIILSNCVNIQYYTVEDGLWTTILYVSAWNLSGPWSRYICNYFGSSRICAFRCIVGLATVFLFIGIVIPGQILSFGVFGGMVSKLIYTQLKQTATEKFDMDSAVFEGNIQVARALALLIMPHFTLLLVSYYTAYQVKLITAAFLLNIFPAMLIIKPEDDKEEYDEISRYQTLPAFSSQMREMINFTDSVKSEPHKSETTSTEEEEEEEKEIFVASDEHSFYDNHVVNEQIYQPTYLNPLTVEIYYKNAGVSILPQIPEEKEHEIDGNDNEDDAAKTLTKVITRLTEITHQRSTMLEEPDAYEELDEGHAESVTMRRDSLKEILNIKDLVSNNYLDGPEKIQNIEYISNYKENRTSFIKELKTINTSACCCSPYRKFIWRRRFRSVADSLIDNIFKPLATSLKDLHFYPSMLSKVVTSITSAIYINLAPYVASEKNNLQPEDATFLLSYIAFSWCLFLVLLPLIINFSEGKIRSTFVCGLLLTGTSMALLLGKMTNDIITISCLLFGFGYGATSYTENMVYKSFMGSRKWSVVKGTLETLSALLVILTYYAIYHFKLDLNLLLLTAIACYYGNAVMWITVPIFKKVIVVLGTHYIHGTQHNTFLQQAQYY